MHVVSRLRRELGVAIRQRNSSCSHHDGESRIELDWWHRLVPYLLGLKRQFTSYQLQQASALRSAYSWKLLELLTRFESTGWAEYDIEDFATSMDATEKQRQDFAKLRTKIIEPAVKELIEKDGWLIQWQPIKAGRKVKAVRFDFRRDDQLRLPLTVPSEDQAPVSCGTTLVGGKSR